MSSFFSQIKSVADDKLSMSVTALTNDMKAKYLDSAKSTGKLEFKYVHKWAEPNYFMSPVEDNVPSKSDISRFEAAVENQMKKDGVRVTQLACKYDVSNMGLYVMVITAHLSEYKECTRSGTGGYDGCD